MIITRLERAELLSLLAHNATVPFEVAIAPPSLLRPYGWLSASATEYWVWNYAKLQKLPAAALYLLYLTYRHNPEA